MECESQGWKTMVRSQNSLTTNAINNFESDPLGTHVLVLAKNISKGEVISQNHLKLKVDRSDNYEALIKTRKYLGQENKK